MAKIGFIIIGRNEEKRLGNCIKSIYDVVKANNIEKYQITYVDSNSVDKSISVAQEYPDVQIFKITSPANAAVGRNIGAKETEADVYCFIDGDMELIPDFFKEVLTPDKSLNYDFISGQFDNYYFDNDGNFLYSEPYHSDVLKSDKFQVTTGGLFMVRREHWDRLNGMRTRFRTCEDLDFGLRMAKKGYKLLRKKDVMAKHFTISYKSFNRMWNDLWNGRSSYRAVLYRTHFNNIHIYKRLAKGDPSLILFILSLLSIVVFQFYESLIIYSGITFVLCLIKEHSGILKFLNRFIYQFVRDVILLFCLLFFYPKNKIISYIKIT